MPFDISHIPFSRLGAYMTVDYVSAGSHSRAGFYLRTLHGDAPRPEICRIELVNDEQPTHVVMSSSLLRLEDTKSFLEMCFADENILRIRGTGIRLIFDFSLYDAVIEWNGGWLINSFSNRMRYALFMKAGAVIHSEIAPSPSRWIFECAANADSFSEIIFSEALLQWPARDVLLADDFENCRARGAQAFDHWLRLSPAVAAELDSARELAAYVQWSSIVAPQGNLKRSAMLMSKHWLNAIWSWDHCFNAVALFKQAPALAWDQLLLMFDHQNECGALPDAVSDKTIVWNFGKPPIHGWALRWMWRHGEIDCAQLQEIYEPLKRWTQWWLTERDAGDGLPQYLHGNDSGWDNASLFDSGLPVQSPDLAAFLVVQMEVIAEIARRLNRPNDAAEWQFKADTLLERMLARFLRDGRFVAFHGEQICAGDSLLLLMPIVLGTRLPEAVRHELIAALKQENRFLTQYGFASESVASPLYESDGYWRGPIWAPAVFLIVESLREIGEVAFADDVALRFCRTVARSGMAENFDALTGRGLRDRAHTWTASVFLLLGCSLQSNTINNGG